MIGNKIVWVFDDELVSKGIEMASIVVNKLYKITFYSGLSDLWSTDRKNIERLYNEGRWTFMREVLSEESIGICLDIFVSKKGYLAYEFLIENKKGWIFDDEIKRIEELKTL